MRTILARLSSTASLAQVASIACIAHEDTCRSWGWVKAGRRRRWGWSYWGVTGEKACDKWHYINRLSSRRRIQNWGYENTPGGDVQSQESWPGCTENTDDFDVGNPFGTIGRLR